MAAMNGKTAVKILKIRKTTKILLQITETETIMNTTMGEQQEENTGVLKAMNPPIGTDNAAIVEPDTANRQTAKNIIRLTIMQPRQSRALKY
jgi:hypothetical protein